MNSTLLNVVKKRKKNKTLSQLFCNLIISFSAVTIFFLLLSVFPEFNWNWKWFCGVGIFVLCSASLYGDEPFNITSNWSPTAIKIKSIIGQAIAATLLLAGFGIMFILVFFL